MSYIRKSVSSNSTVFACCSGRNISCDTTFRIHNKIYKRKIDVIVLVKLNLLLCIALSPPILLIRGLLKSLMRNVGWRKWSYIKVSFISF